MAPRRTNSDSKAVMIMPKRIYKGNPGERRAQLDRVLDALGAPSHIVIDVETQEFLSPCCNVTNEDLTEEQIRNSVFESAWNSLNHAAYLKLFSKATRTEYDALILSKLYAKWQIPTREQQAYRDVLNDLKSDLTTLSQLEFYSEAQSVLQHLIVLRACLKKDASLNTYLHHAQLYCDAADPGQRLALEKILIDKHYRRLNKQIRDMGVASAVVYGLLGGLNVVADSVGIPSFLLSIFNQLWNDSDAVEMGAHIKQQLQQGKMKMGLVNLFGTLQMVVGTALVGLYELSVLIKEEEIAPSLTSATCSAILGFTFAIQYVVSAVVEFTKMRQSQHHMETLKDRLSTIEEKITVCKGAIALLKNSKKKTREYTSNLTALYQERRCLQKDYLIETARCEDRWRNCKSYSACAVAMLVSATAAYLALSALTCGALPVATLVVGLVVLASCYLRNRYVSSVNHSQMASNIIYATSTCNGDSTVPLANNLYRLEMLLDTEKNDPGIFLRERFKTFLATHTVENSSFTAIFNTNIDFNKEVLIPHNRSGLFTSAPTSMSLKKYMDDMTTKNPNKFKKLLDALEHNDRTAFEVILAEKRHRRADYFSNRTETLGTTIFKGAMVVRDSTPQVTAHASSVDHDSDTSSTDINNISRLLGDLV